MLLHAVGALAIGFFGCIIRVIAFLNLASQLRNFFWGLLLAIVMCGRLVVDADGLWVSGNVPSTALGERTLLVVEWAISEGPSRREPVQGWWATFTDGMISERHYPWHTAMTAGGQSLKCCCGIGSAFNCVMPLPCVPRMSCSINFSGNYVLRLYDRKSRRRSN
jgi:hypothetical protein